MIDLVSTRPGTSEEDARCARLLTAVISTAIQDAGEQPSHEEIKKQRNLCKAPCAAIHWLFDKESLFPLYCSLIGVDAESIRKALLEIDAYPGSPSDKTFRPSQRRAIRMRYRWLANDKDVNFKAEDYDDE